MLLISPERFANDRFRDTVLPTVARRSGLFVVDEVHCISDWGHDFRPDYRRVSGILRMLPPGVPVLGTTATANDRVVADVSTQLGDGLVVLRGPLDRESLALDVVPLPSPADRLAWLATTIPTLAGSGIVYTLTVEDARRVAAWLQLRGIAAQPYFGDLETEVKEETEQAFLRDELQGDRRDVRARHGVRQAERRLRDPLPVAGLADRLLPAGGPGRARHRAGRTA